MVMGLILLAMHVPSGAGLSPPLDIHMPSHEEFVIEAKEAEKQAEKERQPLDDKGIPIY